MIEAKRGDARAGSSRAVGMIAMTVIGAISMTAGTAWGRSVPTTASRSPIGVHAVRLEHRLDGPRAASIAQRASETREIEANAPDAPSFREPGRTPIVASSAMVPVSRDPELRGPHLTATREVPIARGGGPAATVQRFSREEVGVARGLSAAGPSTVSAPIGCSRIQAVAAPEVRRLALSVTNEQGRSIASVERNGRFAMLPFCPRDDGQYFVTARAVGGNVPDPVQVFVE